MFRLAMRLEPDEPSFHISLAELLNQVGRGQESQQIFARVIEQNPDDTLVLTGYASFLVAQNRSREAEEVFGRVMRLSPRNANLRVRYGLFLQTLGRESDAEKQFKRAIKIAPKNPFAYYNLASLHLSQKKVSSAEKLLAQAAQADPLLASPAMLLGQIRFAQARFKEALRQYRKALNLSIEAHQKQQLKEFISQTERMLVQEKIQSAKQEMERRRYRRAWSVYVEALTSAPEDRDLRDAILEFQADHSQDADLSLLPESSLTMILRTTFWRRQLQAQTLWERGERSKGAG